MVLQLLATGAAMGFVYCLVAIEYSLISVSYTHLCSAAPSPM